MPSPIPVSRLLPKEFYPSIDLGPCSSPLEKHVKDSTLHLPSQGFKARNALKLWSCVIQWKQLRLLHPLGSGGFGSVYKGTYYGKTVAVKKVKKCTKNRLASRQSFWSELNAAHLQHENIVRIVAATTCIPESVENQDNIGTIIMEFAGTATLHHVIYNHAPPLETETCFRFSKDIANGLHFLHSHCIIHLDLKPANVLVTDGNICKIADFGCSQKVDNYNDISPARPQNCHLGGTYTHRAPELLKGENASFKADIYSFGITFWQLMTRGQPYTGDRQAVLYAVVAYDLRPAVTDGVFNETPLGQTCKAFMCRCWNKDPRERPSAKELIGKVETLQDLLTTM
ncbi:proto-oncogene serine/threonine-protein kinase mos [Lepisosteus oculatus]|uniref:proto-oncogene serine/threonine-protein kinase mos n=1 Tax=Lepisosteus oculatus TaxID=7918 RepID=UPI0003EABBE7|nr:PREDICTED: proto-oncogene serine/threonine-protein kinase mos [Lepisosteus oculatus]